MYKEVNWKVKAAQWISFYLYSTIWEVYFSEC
jgi:hypothetical protein